MTAVIAPVSVVVVTAPTAAAAQAGPSCDQAKASEREAISTAVACDRPVPVESSRTEYVQVVAQPDGRLRFESAVEPQRTRRADGSWVDVDLTLRAGPDGLLRPAASAADVAFSGGGDAPMVSLKRGRQSMSFTWPGRLPAPALSGDSATYAEVLPDTDLVVRATRTGFTHVVVLKSKRASMNPAIRSITLKRGGNTRIDRLGDGALQATVGEALFARAEPAVMWDSSLPQDGTTAPGQDARVARSDAVAAGDGARTARVETQVTDGGLRLVPDATLLDSADAKFPIFVDPAWSVVQTKWAYGTSNNCTNTDYSVARVGLSPDGPCVGARFRSYFEFPTTNGKVSLKGKYIYDAYVQMSLYHSWSCTSTTANMYLTPVINATMKASYTSMTLKSHLDAASGHANKGSGCEDSPQDDMFMNFDSDTVKSQVQTAATGNWNSITVGFSARDSDGTDEGTQDRWKKFTPGKAKLVVDYDSYPGKPNNLQVSGVACTASGAISIGTLTPTFSAAYPDADAGQVLTGAYEWIEVPAGGMGTVTDTYPARKTPPNRPSATAGGRATTTAVTVVKGKTYAYRVTASDPAPYSRWSGWGAWCQFKVDTTVPSVSVTVVNAPTGPGTPGTFRIESSHTDVTQFKYGWTGATTVVAASGTPKSATVTLNVPKYGQNILYVAAVDVTLNEGSGSKEILVGRPSPAVGHWGLETYPGQTQDQALEDKQKSLSFDTPLTATDVTWTDAGRLVGGQVATFNGTSSQAITSQAAVNTVNSFSVAAWLKVDSFTGCVNLSAVSADGPGGSGFILEYDCWADRFRMRVADKDGGTLVEAHSTAPIQMRRWTHVAGVWDKVDKKVKLYVDGVLAEAVTPPSTWLTSRGDGYLAGNLVVGRSRWYGTDQGYFRGQIADVQVFDRVLLDQDFTGARKGEPGSSGIDEPGFLTPIQVGRWDFGVARPCYLQDFPDTCDARDGTGFGRWLALQRGAEIGAGNRDNGLHLDGFYFPEENQEPWETTGEWARTAFKDGVTVDGDGNETTVWRNTPVLRTDQSFTVSAWTKLDRTDVYQTLLVQDGVSNAGFYLYYGTDNGGVWKLKMLNGAGTPDDGTGATFAVAPAPDAGESWHHIVGVLDVGRRQITLYVNGDLMQTTPLPAGWQPWQANGPLGVGRSFGNWHPLYGAVDDISVHQGAMTDAQVQILFDSEVVAGEEL